MMRLPIATKASKGRSVQLSAEMLVNMYAEEAPAGAKSPVVALGCPGLSTFANISTARIRGMHRMMSDPNITYAVIGTRLYAIYRDGSAAQLGTIAYSDRVSMADNGEQLCIVAGRRSYIYSGSEGLRAITDPGFPIADSVTYMDGYFIFSNRERGRRGQFFISALRDGTVYDATDFASAERYPDDLVRVFADHSELLLFGTDSIEIWFNAGHADFPFARAQGSIIEQGLGAKWSVEKLDESVLWLDNECMVRRLEGITPVRVSTHAVEYQISRGDWQNAYAWSYSDEGHQFYVLTIPATEDGKGAGTYVYDAATQLWHVRKSYDIDFFRAAFYVNAFGKHLVGDYRRGNIYEMSLDIYRDVDDPLVSQLVFPQVQNDGRRFIVHELQLDCEVGSGAPPARAVESFSWDIVGESFTGGIGSPRLTALDDSSVAVYSSAGTLTKYVFDGAAWAQDGQALTGLSKGSPRGVAAMSATRVALVEGGVSAGTVRCVDFDGSEWRQVGAAMPVTHANVVGISAMSSSRVALAGTQGSAPAPGRLQLLEFDGSTWSRVGEPLELGTTGSTKIAALDEASVAYVDDRNLRLTTFRHMGSEWEQDGNWLDVNALGVPGIGALSHSRIMLTGEKASEAVIFDFNGVNWSRVTGIEPLTIGSGITFLDGLSETRVAVANQGSNSLTAYDLANGVTNTTIVDRNEVMLDISKDGRTWSMSQLWRSLGDQGEYSNRVIWRRLGQHRTFTPKISISAPIRRAVFTAYAKIEPCD